MNDRTKSNIPFAGLHAHSGVGSPFDGLGYPAEHMEFAFQNGNDSLALTDHGNMNGFAYQVQHAREMIKEGKEFKPIFGVEAYFLPSIDEWREQLEKAKADKKAKKNIDKSQAGTTIEDESTKREVKNILNRRRHLILLAQNQKGLNNIFSLVSKSYSKDNFYRFPRMDYKTLSEHSEGVIAASACLGGIYAGNYWENVEQGDDAVLSVMRDTTEKMVSIFSDRWYGELQWNNIPEQHHLNQLIIKVCAEYDVKLVSTADSHYPTQAAWKDRELYKRLGWLGRGIPKWADGTELPVNVDAIGYELFPKNGDQMWEAYKKYSKETGASYNDTLIHESIERTHHIAHNRIEKFMPDNTVRLPSFVVPAGQTADRTLVAACVDGMRSLGLKDNPEYIARLKEEVNVISDRGFSKYFLTMKSIADKATDVQLTGAGRGSAAGSLVAYALGITQVDPIKYNLLFSRFMTKDSKEYPDIDYDVSSPMELKEMLIEEWGGNTVVPISNFNKLQLRSLIKDIAKLYDVPFIEANSVTSKMMAEATPIAKKLRGIKAGVYVPNFEEVMQYSDSLKKFLAKYPKIKTHVEALVGEVRSVSRHAGGVVIGEDLDKHMPLINSGGVTQTPWSEGQHVRQLEPMGFIKFDILGLSTLKMIEGAITHILRRHHGVDNPTFQQIKEYYEENLHPEKINLKDQKVYKNVFWKGKWAGIFQFAEKGAQYFCKRSKPKNIIDIAAVTAVYRPGPLCLSEDTEVLRSFAYYDTNDKSCKKGSKRSTTRHTLKDLYNLFHKPYRKNYLYLPSYDEEGKAIVKNRVVNVVKSGVKEVYSIKYQRRSDGDKKIVTTSILNNKSKDKQHNLESTLDHRFLTKKGWKRLGDLVEGDYILVVNEGCQTGKHPLDGRIDRKTAWGRKNFRNIAFYYYDYKCVMCDWDRGSLDVNHLEGNRNTNNNPENLCYLCPNHHRQYTEGTLTKERILNERKTYEHPIFTRDLMYVRYIGKEYERKIETYDIEMENPHHNFFAGGCVVHNSANVHETFRRAKENPKDIEYGHKIVKEVTKETYGFLIFQEQIALLAHKLGKDISLDEGNKLRKLLTKKGTGEVETRKTKIRIKFVAGCIEKGLTEKWALKMWQKFEFFSGYGFNKSHAVSYSIISFQCAWLFNYYPAEWMAAFLDKEPESRKEKAINIAKKFGFKIRPLDINKSMVDWTIDEDNKTLIQPLTSIKGLGEKAIEQIIEHRPFSTVEELLFSKEIVYSKLNKKAINVLIKAEALNDLMDDRFNNLKHFWTVVADNRPKTKKKLDAFIEEYKDIEDFTRDEYIETKVNITGVFPFNLIMSDDVIKRLDFLSVPAISDWDRELGVAWFIPREVIKRKTVKGRPYYVVKTIDKNSAMTDVRCWGIDPEKDKIYINRPYLVKLTYQGQWGYSTRGGLGNWKLLG